MIRASALLAAACWLACVAVASANEAAAPAFQGHAAEMQMRDPQAERQRRALFFDPVDIEIGPQGLPCDHLLRSRPQVVAGTGHVLIATVRAQGGKDIKSVRVWFPPGAAAGADEARQKSLAEIAARLPDAAALAVEQRSFAWCR